VSDTRRKPVVVFSKATGPSRAENSLSGSSHHAWFPLELHLPANCIAGRHGNGVDLVELHIDVHNFQRVLGGLA
jgi:hypothetical protein